MFKATDISKSIYYVTLDYDIDNIDTLLNLTKKNSIICPYCEAKLRVKTGEERKWHFFHQHNESCFTVHEKFQITKARGMLYRKFKSVFNEKLTIEEQILPNFRLIDFCIKNRENDTNDILYLTEPTLKESRNGKLLELQKICGSIVFIFLWDNSIKINRSSQEITLKRIHKNLAYETLYSDTNQYSISFLDITTNSIKTFRGLINNHGLKYYYESFYEDGVNDIRVHKENGLFIHNEEYEYLKKCCQKEKQSRLKKHEIIGLKLLNCSQNEESKSSDLKQVEYSIDNNSNSIQKKDLYSLKLKCRHCGIETLEWATADYGNNTCECRSCYYK